MKETANNEDIEDNTDNEIEEKDKVKSESKEISESREIVDETHQSASYEADTKTYAVQITDNIIENASVEVEHTEEVLKVSENEAESKSESIEAVVDVENEDLVFDGVKVKNDNETETKSDSPPLQTVVDVTGTLDDAPNGNLSQSELKSLESLIYREKHFRDNIVKQG